jgi:hypothetical protein
MPSPSPYPGGASPYAFEAAISQLLRPAKTAGILMIVMGSLLLLLALLIAVALGALPQQTIDEIYSDLVANDPNLAAQLTSQQFAQMVPTIGVCLGVTVGIFALAVLIMGIFTRGGGSGALITGVILNLLAAAILALIVVGGLVEGVKDPSALIGVAIFAVPLALLIVTVVLQFKAMGNRQGIDSIRQQQWAGMQYQQYQQYQAYQQYPQYPPQSPPQPPQPPSGR